MGKWVTIRGAHVYIEDDGTISKGPKALKEKNYIKKDMTLYHASDADIVEFDEYHFGKNSLGGLTKGDAVYFDTTKEGAKSFNKKYVQKAYLKNMKVINEDTYEKILAKEYKSGNTKAYNTSERRYIMLQHGVDAVEYGTEVAVFNINKLNKSMRFNLR